MTEQPPPAPGAPEPSADDAPPTSTGQAPPAGTGQAPPPPDSDPQDGQAPPYGQAPAYGATPPPYGAPPPYAAPPVYGQAPAGSYGSGVVPMSASDERTWAVLAHLSPFVAGFVGLPFLGPLVVFLMYKDRSPYVRRHSAEALNFQLTVLIGLLVSIPLIFVVIGIFTAIAIVITAFVLQILAAVAANRGDDYRYPLTLRFVS